MRIKTKRIRRRPRWCLLSYESWLAIRKIEEEYREAKIKLFRDAMTETMNVMISDKCKEMGIGTPPTFAIHPLDYSPHADAEFQKYSDMLNEEIVRGILGAYGRVGRNER